LPVLDKRNFREGYDSGSCHKFGLPRSLLDILVPRHGIFTAIPKDPGNRIQQCELKRHIIFEMQRDYLPVQLTSLLGRELETTTLRKLLCQPEVRLVTITGPGGVGKTSLALHVARELQDAFTDGVFFVSLADTTESTLIIPTIAHTLGVTESSSRLLLDSLKDFLRDEQTLLLLDNFEQIISIAPLLTELLKACAGLRILVTSREALRLRGEHEFPLAPLALPGQPSFENLLQYPGIALFVERAQAIQPDFQLTPEDANAVAEICARLDGLPLAIELAAARIKLLPPQAMLAHLRDAPLQLLIGGARDLPARQQTLRGTIQWSYELLNADEQRLFRWLSVLVGGCTFEVAKVICEQASLDNLDSLVNKSLLVQHETDHSPRLSMLETIREFGLEQLTHTHELESARRAHAAYYLKFAEDARQGLTGADQKSWLQRLEREQDNLRAALHWAMEHNQAEFAQRMAGALQPFWFRRGRWSEGRRWLEDSLAMESSATLNQSIRANALYGAGMLARFQGDFAQARMLCDQSLEIYRALANQTGMLKTLAQLCRITRFQIDQEATKAYIAEAASLIETLPDSVVKGEAYTDMALAMLDFSIPKFQPEVTRYLAESERIHRALDNQSGLALASLHRAIRASFEGDSTLAVSRFEEAERLAMELGDVRLLSRMAGGQALLDFHEGDFAAARRRLETSIQQYDSMGDHQLHSNLMMLAAALHKQGQDIWAVRVWGMADVFPGNRHSYAIVEAYAERFGLSDIFAELRAKLGDEAFAREIEVGHQLRLDDLRAIPHSAPSAPGAPTSAPGASLTARELEVLRLLAQNLSNPQIAERLVVSRRTVDAHLRSIYDKLGVESRDAAIRVAGEKQLI
jgi:predicted ATPase/DNA-binding CsgD family transcriptional regulator